MLFRRSIQTGAALQRLKGQGHSAYDDCYGLGGGGFIHLAKSRTSVRSLPSPRRITKKSDYPVTKRNDRCSAVDEKADSLYVFPGRLRLFFSTMPINSQRPTRCLHTRLPPQASGPRPMRTLPGSVCVSIPSGTTQKENTVSGVHLRDDSGLSSC